MLVFLVKITYFCTLVVAYATFRSKITKMIRLNLPSFAIKLSGTQQHPRIFDILRHRYVALTVSRLHNGDVDYRIFVDVAVFLTTVLRR